MSDIDEALAALTRIRGRMCAEGGRVEAFHFENEGSFDTISQALEELRLYRQAYGHPGLCGLERQRVPDAGYKTEAEGDAYFHGYFDGKDAAERQRVPAEFRDLSKLVSELCDSIEANQADVGTDARSVGELLQLIGPAVTKTEDMLAAAPEPSGDIGQALKDAGTGMEDDED